MAILNAQSAELAALLKDNPKRHNVETEIGINVLFIALTTISHCVGVKVWRPAVNSRFVLLTSNSFTAD
jgi:amino acid transporter